MKKNISPFRKQTPNKKRDNILIGIVFIVALLFQVGYSKLPAFQYQVDRVTNAIVSFVENPQQEARKWQAQQNKEFIPGEIKTPDSLSTDSSGIYIDDTFNYASYYEFTGDPYVVVNNNVPNFTAAQLNSKRGYEKFTPLDSLGRVGPAEALITPRMLPTEERESISSVKPSGWNNAKYDAGLVNGEWIYNRCHLIGFQMTGQNANELNLMTGTRYFNVDGMLPFENIVTRHVKNGGVVLYRVTPVFNDKELVARGLYMEAQSLDSADISFFVYVFNNQPGIEIDYLTGLTREIP